MTERREIVISVINKGGAEFWFIGFGVKWKKSFIGVRKKVDLFYELANW